MTIEGDDFKLIPVNDNSLFFDLELLYKIKPKGKEEREEFKSVGYGITLENAIKKIAQFRVNQNHLEEALSINVYLKEYKKELDSLKELVSLS